MKTTVSQPETWKRVIEFEIPAEEFGKAVDAKLGQYRREARLPGFRPGKVPMAVIRQRFGQTAKAEVVDEVVKESFKAACEEHGIEPVSPGTMTDIKELEDGEPLRFTIETEVDPPVEITGYDKLKARPKPKKIKDADVEESFRSLVERFTEFREVERASKKGDGVRIEYRSVVIDGQERDDLRNHNPGYPIELGADGGIKEFEKDLTGVRAGDEVDITVNFPENYSDASTAGKTGEFAVKVLAVLEKHVPEVDGEFLKKVGNFDSVDALKAEIRRNMETEEAARARREAYKEAIEELINANPFEVPPAKVDAYVNVMIEDFAEKSGAGVPIDQMREELEESFRAGAVGALKRMRIIEYVAEKEKIKATQEDVDAEIRLIAERYGHGFDELKQVFRKNGTTNRIRLEVRERKTLDFLIGENDNK